MLTKELYQLFLKNPIVDTDTRKIRKGSIFFALKGENFNGNHFAAQALEKGADYVVTDENTDTPPHKTIRRKSSLLALQQLAAEHRRHLPAKVIGITGTNGKTTTKELLNAVLSKKYNVYATQGNLNNHIGVPLTLLNATAGDEILIVEMGASHPGEIADLCRIADPDAGIITNIGKAHLEGFGDENGVYNTKKALFDHIIHKNGTLFFPEKEKWLHTYKDYPKAYTYGDGSGLLSGKIISACPAMNVNIISGDASPETFNVEINTHLFGEYNLSNILAATAVGIHFNINCNQIAEAIEAYIPQNNRSQILQTSMNVIILDAYNANPTSMANALLAFSKSVGQQKAVILGDMLELGEKSEIEHLTILKMLETLNLKKIFLVGKKFSKVNNQDKFIAFTDVEHCRKYLAKKPLEGYTILIKGSRGISLEKLKDIV